MTYSIRIRGRGDEMTYQDTEVRLHMERTDSFGHRLYCDNTAHLPLPKREQIINNLCEHFKTPQNPTIFVIDEKDKDRNALAGYLNILQSAGHQLEIEWDSEEIRRDFCRKLAEETKKVREERYGPDLQLKMF